MLLVLICLTACGRTDGRILRAADDVARLAVDQWPDLPADCRVRLSVGVSEGDRLDVVALRYSAALAAQNDRVSRCAAWYDENKGGA